MGEERRGSQLLTSPISEVLCRLVVVVMVSFNFCNLKISIFVI